MHRCSSCGRQVNPGAAACPQCGSLIGGSSTGSPPGDSGRPASAQPGSSPGKYQQGDRGKYQQGDRGKHQQGDQSALTRRRTLLGGGVVVVGGLGLYFVLGGGESGEAAELAEKHGISGTHASDVEIIHTHEPTHDDVTLEVVDHAFTKSGFVVIFENVGPEPVDFDWVGLRLYQEGSEEAGHISLHDWGFSDLTKPDPESMVPIAPEGDIHRLEGYDGTPSEPGEVGGFLLEFDPTIDEMEQGTQLDGPYGVEIWFEGNFYRIEFVATF